MLKNRNHFSQDGILFKQERIFGILILFVLLGIGLLVDIELVGLKLGLICFAIFVFLLTVFRVNYLKIPLKYWIKFGELISKIISPIILLFMYLIVFVPTGLLLRIFGKDVLQLKSDKESESYWVKRTQPVGKMKNQF